MNDIKELAIKLDNMIKELLDSEPSESTIEKLKELNEQLDWIDIIY